MNNSDLIQNIPNTRERIPAAKGAKALARFFEAQQWTAYFLGMLVFLFGALLYFSVSGMLNEGTRTTESPPTAEVVLLGISIAGFVLVAGLLYLLYKRSANLPAKEQIQYYRLGNVRPLTAAQAKALRLHIVEMYHGGFWLKTLEYFPCNIRVNDPKFKPSSFYVADKHNYRQGLNDDWGIVSKVQYDNMAEELFGGMHSKLFALDMDYFSNYKLYMRGGTSEDLKNIENQKTNFINRLAGLIDKPAAYVNACFEAQSGKPKPLLWGFDLWRVIPMSREAFMAGYITEADAWSNILKASDLVYYLFDSFESFYDNLRLGNAYWSNDLKVTAKRHEMWALYEKECDWSQRNLPWTFEQTPEIPEEMHTGFTQYIRQKNKLHNEVGFRFNEQPGAKDE